MSFVHTSGATHVLALLIGSLSITFRSVGDMALHLFFRQGKLETVRTGPRSLIWCLPIQAIVLSEIGCLSIANPARLE
jgi:hypothetical protein